MDKGASMTSEEQQLLRYLRQHCSGKRNAQSAPVIASEFRIPDRKVRAMVRSLRMSGECIAGVLMSGFFLPLTREEGEHTLVNLVSQEMAIAEVLCAYELALEDAFGEVQLPMEVGG